MSLVLSRRTALVGMAALAVAAPARAGAWTQTEALLARYVAQRKVSGAVAVVQRGRGAPQYLARGAQALGGPDADERTLWRIFSMTKPITGVAAMKLIEARKLGLDQPVADLVPEFAAPKVLENGATRPARAVMRVRHLLTHTAGLGYSINAGSPLAPLYLHATLQPGDPTPRENAPKSLDEFGARLATLPLGSDPGTRYEYSVALDLLGLVIQRASGMAFEDYLRTALFAPLGMHDTGFYAMTEARPRLSMNYVVRASGIEATEPPGRSPYMAAPAYPSGGAGLLSSAHDYARFCAMLRGDGILDGVRVLAPSTARRAHANLLPRGVLADGLHHGAGMGVIVRPSDTYALPRGSYFWGGAAGTWMWIDPAADLSAILMTQYMPSRAYPLWREFGAAIYEDIARA